MNQTAAPNPPPSEALSARADECDFCHRTLRPDEWFHRLTVGMNEEGPGGSFTLDTSAVEETSELLTCSKCRPAVDALVDRFLSRLWALVAPEEAVPSTLRAFEGPVSTPYGLVTTESIAIGTEMMAVAARGCPASPEGFALGIVVGRLAQAGLDARDISLLVDKALAHPVAVSEPS